MIQVGHDQLYITGRLKDLIIIHGRNHYPQDIEFTVSNGGDMGWSRACAPRLVCRRKLARLWWWCRSDAQIGNPTLRPLHSKPGVLLQTHEIKLHALVLIKPLSVDRTSSGKIKRSATRQAYLNGTVYLLSEQATLPAPTAVPASTASRTTARHNASEIEHWLCQKTADLLLMPLSKLTLLPHLPNMA